MDFLQCLHCNFNYRFAIDPAQPNIELVDSTITASMGGDQLSLIDVYETAFAYNSCPIGGTTDLQQCPGAGLTTGQTTGTIVSQAGNSDCR